MNQDSVIISDPERAPIVVQRRQNDAGFVIHAPKTLLALSNDEAERFAQFIRNEARLLAYPVATPAKARFEPVDD